MPFGDRTGPRRRGKLTGRGLGYCAGYRSPGYTKGTPRSRRRFGRFGCGMKPRFGRRFGRGPRFRDERIEGIRDD